MKVDLVGINIWVRQQRKIEKAGYDLLAVKFDFREIIELQQFDYGKKSICISVNDLCNFEY